MDRWLFKRPGKKGRTLLISILTVGVVGLVSMMLLLIQPTIAGITTSPATASALTPSPEPAAIPEPSPAPTPMP
ncbi:MAG TPA: hypothetical protein VIL27_10340, partial [Clostridia bacterium]